MSRLANTDQYEPQNPQYNSEIHMSLQTISNPLKNRWTIALIIIATAIASTSVYYGISQMRLTSKQSQPAETIPKIQQVTALGRLEPIGEVIKVSVPATLNNDRIAKLLVKRGDRVKAGQVIAIMSSRDRLQTTLLEAQQQVKIAQAELAKVKAGAKQGQIEAQQATIARLKVENSTQAEAQQATIARLTVERNTEVEAQKAAIARLRVERNTEAEAQKATIARLQGERDTEIAAQLALIERFFAELSNANAEYERYEKLLQQGAVSISLRDSKRLTQQTAQQQVAEARANLKRIQASRQQQIVEARANLKRIEASRLQQLAEAQANLNRIEASRQQQQREAEANLKRIQSSGKEQVNEATATLSQIAEVRSVDVQAAQAEVNKAIASVKKAEVDLADASIRAPSSGRIMSIHAKPGEVVGSNGIADLGQTDQMQVVAEVYQTDISKIRSGQQAAIASESFSGKIQGKVSEIGLQVTPQEVSSGQPGENLDRRVVEVRIRLDPESSKQVANLTNLQVQVAIQL